MEISLEVQSQGFYLACAAGFALGAVFDIFRILRVLLRCEKRPVFFQDLFCMALAGFVTFTVSLAVNWGETRFYIIAGEIIGGCIYFLTVGEVTVRIAKLIYRMLRAVKRFLKKWIFMPVYRLFARIFAALAKKLRRKQKTLKKVMVNHKNPLKPRCNVLYNCVTNLRNKRSSNIGRQGSNNEGYQSQKAKG